MSQLNRLFRKRLALSENEAITFETLDLILERFATTIPFENLRILNDQVEPVSRDSLLTKILINQEGGLCYELNPLFYFFLLENGFDVTLIRANVLNAETNRFSPLGKTHVTILLRYEGQKYLLETGFGGNLPLKPVPFSGETVTSANGSFRIIPMQDEAEYDYALELKLKHKDSAWRVGHAFHSERPVTNLAELSEIQTIVAEHEISHFNKAPLVTQLTESGNVTLTDTTFTEWKNGEMKKQTIDDAQFQQLAKQIFGLS
ncbi:arylamine N-acetyltransferase [Ammoniphilus oxalaticus]|uniref:Arylamine N-acetyltransferase n=1 Tax=Ammoniphilus oxalaticus TaxID=66863 RepID=A0A419SJL7_9BACL|nr:arylamine N-acetyltransferase [Ammoniphilus oxalaticus]RKD24234.1 arylamine N-acetyltransferase [Ammoniphilus oxalaticus]